MSRNEVSQKLRNSVTGSEWPIEIDPETLCEGKESLSFHQDILYGVRKAALCQCSGSGRQMKRRSLVKI